MIKLNIAIESLKQQIKQMGRDIEDKQGEIVTAQSNIETFEYSCSEEQFNEFLDDVYSDVEICGMTYAVSYALKELDPTAYRCAKSDYESNFDLSDCEEYQELQSQLDELESQLNDLQTKFDELQQDLDELEMF